MPAGSNFTHSIHLPPFSSVYKHKNITGGSFSHEKNVPKETYKPSYKPFASTAHCKLMY